MIKRKQFLYAKRPVILPISSTPNKPDMRKHNPFTPGAGKTPPCLVGRQAEQSQYREYLERMRDDKTGEMIIMYGPCGVGKTVLLNWLERQCDKAGYIVAQAGADDGGALANKLARLLPFNLKPGPLSIGGDAQAGIGALLKGAAKTMWHAVTGNERNLDERLLNACKKNPRVFLLDEAHSLGESDRKRLLALAQRLTDQAPFLLVLCGTPGLMQSIRNGATFVERAPKMSIGLLDPQAAAEAIAVPLQEDGITIERPTLDAITRHAQRYPFFIQQWGKALWARAKTENIRHLRDEDAQKLRAAVDSDRRDFYAARYMRMRDDTELLAAAAAVGEAFKGKDSMSIDAVTTVIKKTIAPASADDKARDTKANELERELNRIDYIWYPPCGEARPGIPSFMDYISERYVERVALERGISSDHNNDSASPPPG